MCGSLYETQEIVYGKTLAPFRIDLTSGTDFCHWVSRFHYSPMSPSLEEEGGNHHHCHDDNNQRSGHSRSHRNTTATTTSTTRKTRTTSTSIHDYIAQSDRGGMDMIATQTSGAFAQYLKQTRNTVRGSSVATGRRSDNDSNTNGCYNGGGGKTDKVVVIIVIACTSMLNPWRKLVNMTAVLATPPQWP